MKFTSPKGFGLLEVLVAAVVLGFLIVGLTRLQLGNREAILRIRARDAANIIAQHVLDSLGAVGINLIEDDVPDAKIIDNKPRDYDFEGKAGKALMEFFVDVEYLPSPSSNSGNFIDEEIDESTSLGAADSKSVIKNKFAKNIQATVSWKFKGSEQSIKMSKVVR